MQNEILNYFGKAHAQYLHARGKMATGVLIDTLQCKPDEDVLEIGFGTGTTLTQLYSNHKKTNFYGVEQSPLMFKKAKARLKYACIGESIHLSLMKDKGPLPYESNFFDKVYVESVLAIQEGEDLARMLTEINRVLRPGGLLVINETIWLDSIDMTEIVHINAMGKQCFGIIQSNSAYPYLNNWKDLLSHLNFEWLSANKLDEMKTKHTSRFTFPYQLLSSIFTGIGKIKAGINSRMRDEKKKYNQQMNQIVPHNRKLMEGIIIVARKRK